MYYTYLIVNTRYTQSDEEALKNQLCTVKHVGKLYAKSDRYPYTGFYICRLVIAHWMLCLFLK